MSARIALALIVALGVGPAAAGGFGIPEIGVRRTAMAATIGRPDEASAIYHNPAGLVLQRGWHLYLSITGSIVSTSFQIHSWDQSDRFLGVTPDADGYYAPVKPSRAFGAAPILAVTGEVLPGRLTLGAAAFVGNGMGAAFPKNAVSRYHLIEGYIIAPQAVVAGAYRLGDTISVGATAGVLRMMLHGEREVFPIVNGTDISTIAGTRPRLVLDGNGWAPTWTIAAFGQPHPKVTWGATVVGRIDATLEGPVEITFSDDAPSPGDQLIGKQSTKMLLPWSFLGGVNVDVTPHIEIGAEMRYWLYRQYKKMHTDVVGIFLVRELETIKNYRDSFQVSGGIRVHDLASAPGLELMLGTHFDRTPAPAQTVTLDQPTFNHVGLHTGLRYAFGRYRLGASYLHYFYDIPTVTNSITMPPSNFKGSGQNNIAVLSIEAKL